MADKDTYSSGVIVASGADLVCRSDSISERRASLPSEGLLVQVHAAGVCHTDVHQWLGGYKLTETTAIRFVERPGYGYPRVPGHEVSGTVFSLGSGVSPDLCDLKEGDRVAVFPWLGCGECRACRAEEETLCRGTTRELGMTMDGGYAEYMAVPHYRYTAKIPSAIGYEVGATLGCGCLTAYNAVKTALPTVEKVAQFASPIIVGVLGTGGVGQWALTLARQVYREFDVTLVAIDVKAETLESLVRRKLADKSLTVDAAKSVEETAEEAKSLIGGRFDVILDFVNNPATFSLAQTILEKGGEHVCLGLFGGTAELKLPIVPLKRIKITGVQTGSLADFRELVKFIKTHPISPPPFTYYQLSEATQALKDVEKGRVNGRAILKMAD